MTAMSPVGVAATGELESRRRVALAADRALPSLLALLLVALMASITAAGILTALAIGVWLLRFLDPTVRSTDEFPLVLPLAAFAAATLLSVAFADDRVLALIQSKHLLAIPVFFVAVNALRGSQRVLRLFTWLFAAVAVVSVYAMLQTAACTSSVDLPPWTAWALKMRSLERCRSMVPFRAKGLFSIYMTLGGSLLLSLSVLLALLAGNEWRRRRWLALPTALALIALGLSQVRNAWVGLGAAVLVLLVLTRRLVLLVPVALAVLAAVAVPSPLQTRVLSLARPPDDSARERLYMWQAGIRMLRGAPLTGLGPGAVRLRYPEYRSPEARKERTGHLHNNLAQIGAERGLLGLAAWLAIWAAFFVRAARIHAALPPGWADARALVAGSIAAVAGFLVAGLFEYNFGDSEVIGLCWLLMAVPFACDREARAASGGEPAPPL